MAKGAGIVQQLLEELHGRSRGDVVFLPGLAVGFGHQVAAQVQALIAFFKPGFQLVKAAPVDQDVGGGIV